MEYYGQVQALLEEEIRKKDEIIGKLGVLGLEGTAEMSDPSLPSGV